MTPCYFLNRIKLNLSLSRRRSNWLGGDGRGSFSRRSWSANRGFDDFSVFRFHLDPTQNFETLFLVKYLRRRCSSNARSLGNFRVCHDVNFYVVYLGIVLLNNLVEHRLESAAGSARGRRVHHHQHAVTLVIKFTERELAIMLSGLDIERFGIFSFRFSVFSSLRRGLRLLLGLMILDE